MSFNFFSPPFSPWPYLEWGGEQMSVWCWAAGRVKNQQFAVYSLNWRHAIPTAAVVALGNLEFRVRVIVWAFRIKELKRSSWTEIMVLSHMWHKLKVLVMGLGAWVLSMSPCQGHAFPSSGVSGVVPAAWGTKPEGFLLLALLLFALMVCCPDVVMVAALKTGKGQNCAAGDRRLLHGWVLILLSRFSSMLLI